MTTTTMIKFKEFFIKSLLHESPKNTDDFESPYSDFPMAQDMYNQIILNPNEYKKVFTLHDKHKVDLMLNQDGDDMMLYFVPREGDHIHGYATYELRDDGGIEMVSVYNRPLYFGLAQSVYMNYLILNHKYVMSNGFHSKSGKSFWRKIVSFALFKNMNVYIWDDIKNIKITNIVNIQELDEFYGDDVDFERYRIRVEE